MQRSIGAVAALGSFWLASGLSGCVATNVVIQGYDNGPSKINFTLVDARPTEDKEFELGSIWATSCSLGIRRLGDDASSPARLEILRQDIEKKLGDKVANTTLTVTRYRMFLNRSRKMLDASESNGLVGALLTPNDCTKDKTPVGWYDPGEATSFNSPFVVEIKASYKGRDYEARAVSSPDIEILGGYRNADVAPSVYAAIEKANLALIDQLRH